LEKKLLLKTITLFVKPLIWLVIITILCLMPADKLPSAPFLFFPGFDKLVHFGLYFILALLLFRPLTQKGWKVVMPVLLITMLVGGIIEALQFFLTQTRSADWGDFLADLTGAVCGLLAYDWLVKGRTWERWI